MTFLALGYMDGTHIADGSTPVHPGRGASRMLRVLMLRDLAFLLVNRPKKNVYIFS